MQRQLNARGGRARSGGLLGGCARGIGHRIGGGRGGGGGYSFGGALIVAEATQDLLVLLGGAREAVDVVQFDQAYLADALRVFVGEVDLCGGGGEERGILLEGLYEIDCEVNMQLCVQRIVGVCVCMSVCGRKI